MERINSSEIIKIRLNDLKGHYSQLAIEIREDCIPALPPAIGILSVSANLFLFPHTSRKGQALQKIHIYIFKQSAGSYRFLSIIKTI